MTTEPAVAAASTNPDATPATPRLLRDDAVWDSLPVREVEAFGVTLRGRLPVSAGWAPPSARAPKVEVMYVAEQEVEARFSGGPVALWSANIDDRVFEAVRGAAGDVLMRHHGAGTFRFSASEGELLVGAASPRSVAAARTLLDTALFTVALETGHEALHGAGLGTPAGVLVVVGPSGAGKSSLGAALRAEGLRFFSDDIVVNERVGDSVIAHPGPPVSTLPSGGPRDADVLADLGDELWVARAVADTAAPIAGIVALGTDDQPDPVESPLMSVLPHLLRLPAERARQRFERASDLAATVPVLHVGARSAPPAALAQTVLTRLRSAGVPL